MKLNSIIGPALSALVFVSLILLLFGLLLFIICSSSSFAVDFLQELAGLNPITYITLSIVLLLATPFICILIALIAFIIAKETLYAVISLVVLAFSALIVITSII
jgi:uncharacterized membrane protein